MDLRQRRLPASVDPPVPSKRRRQEDAGETKDCPICNEPTTPDDVITTTCRHTFHRTCLKMWCDGKRQCPCPMCRADLGMPFPQQGCASCGSAVPSHAGRFESLCGHVFHQHCLTSQVRERCPIDDRSVFTGTPEEVIHVTHYHPLLKFPDGLTPLLVVLKERPGGDGLVSVRHLLEHGVDVNESDELPNSWRLFGVHEPPPPPEGRSWFPLMYAARYQTGPTAVEVAQVLIHAGARIRETNGHGLTALDIAERYQPRSSLVSFLRLEAERAAERFARDSSFGPVPDRQVSGTYVTHDNGGRAFQVTIDGDRRRALVEYFRDPSDDENSENSHEQVDHRRRLNVLYRKVWLSHGEYLYDGESPEEENRGACVLLETSHNQYTYIGSTVYTFQTPEPIEKLYAMIGNSDVVYSVARSERFSYDLTDGYQVSNQEMRLATNEREAVNNYWHGYRQTRDRRLPPLHRFRELLPRKY